MTKNQNKDPQKITEEWLHFSWAFLDVAEFSCEFWLEAIEKSDFKSKASIRSYIAIVFNIKHSLELFLKRCIVSYFGKLDKNDYSHNIKDLYAKFLTIDFGKIKTRIIEAENGKVDYSQPISVVRNIINQPKSFDTRLSKLEKLVDDYYHLKFSKNIEKTNIILEDIENTVFKYPENNLSASFDYLDLLEKIRFSDFKELKKDITLLEWCYSNIGFVIRQYEDIDK